MSDELKRYEATYKVIIIVEARSEEEAREIANSSSLNNPEYEELISLEEKA